ncbi:MAG: hypothetical protein R2932_03360 [Caldilineaceae bacterium]
MTSSLWHLPADTPPVHCYCALTDQLTTDQSNDFIDEFNILVD